MPIKSTPISLPKKKQRRRKADWNLGIVQVDKKASTQSGVFEDEASLASSQSTYDPLGKARNSAAATFKKTTVGRLRDGAAEIYGAPRGQREYESFGTRKLRPGQRGREFVARKRILDAREAEERLAEGLPAPGSRPGTPGGGASDRPGTGKIVPPSFTPLMKAAAAGNEVRVESLLAQPATLVTIFATDHKGRTALDWAQVKGATAVAETLKQAMERELRIKAQDRETKEREHELRRLVQKNMHLRAILHHAINTRDVASLNRAVHAADFTRDDFGKAVNMLKGYAARNKKVAEEGTVFTTDQPPEAPDVAPPMEGAVNAKMVARDVRDERGKRVIQRRFNVGVFEAISERNASTLRVRPER